MSLSKVRREYEREGLTREQLPPSPLSLYEAWIAEALKADIREATAATLATVDDDGHPSARTVLIKDIDPAGITFYTNYHSRKGRQLAGNPRAALLSYWANLERQIEAEGPVERLSDEQSEEYFATRPRGAQLAAWASDQSAVIASREVLEQRFREAEARYDGVDVPKPPHWGGFRLVPHFVHVWQGRPNRLHDRFRYSRSPEGWQIERLAP